MSKQIEVEIDENGEVSLDLIGFQGKGCAELADAIAGGEKPKVSRLKPEYSQQCDRQKEKLRG